MLKLGFLSTTIFALAIACGGAGPDAPATDLAAASEHPRCVGIFEECDAARADDPAWVQACDEGRASCRDCEVRYSGCVNCELDSYYCGGCLVAEDCQ